MKRLAVSRRRQSHDKIEPPSQLMVFVAPLTECASKLFRKPKTLILIACGVYTISGFTVVQSNEVGIVFQFGKLVTTNGQASVYPPGLLFALPRPFHRIVTINVGAVETLTITDVSRQDRTVHADHTTPLEDRNYLLTADRNIIHTKILVRFQISDPIAYTVKVDAPRRSLNAIVLQSTIEVVGGIRLDSLLGEERVTLAHKVAGLAQARLDQMHAGVNIVSLEYLDLTPPAEVSEAFDAVQSAFINAQTDVRDASSYAASVLPIANAQAFVIDNRAKVRATQILSRARSAAEQFRSLLAASQNSPETTHLRLYRETIEQVLGSAAEVSFVPSPVTDGYRGARFIVSYERSRTPPLSTTASSSSEVEPRKTKIPLREQNEIEFNSSSYVRADP
ncbi:MAG: protease modulator HflK [Pseudomonadota bacterium]